MYDRPLHDQLRSLCYRMIDMIDFYERMQAQNTCNSCGKRDKCEYKPQPGQFTRINCFSWESRRENSV